MLCIYESFFECIGKKHIHLLETYISNKNVDFLETSEYLEEKYMDNNNPIENIDSKTFREKSHFGKHFVNITRFCKTWIDKNLGKKKIQILVIYLSL